MSTGTAATAAPVKASPYHYETVNIFLGASPDGSSDFLPDVASMKQMADDGGWRNVPVTRDHVSGDHCGIITDMWYAPKKNRLLATLRFDTRKPFGLFATHLQKINAIRGVSGEWKRSISRKTGKTYRRFTGLTLTDKNMAHGSRHIGFHCEKNSGENSKAAPYKLKTQSRIHASLDSINLTAGYESVDPTEKALQKMDQAQTTAAAAAAPTTAATAAAAAAAAVTAMNVDPQPPVAGATTIATTTNMEGAVAPASRLNTPFQAVTAQHDMNGQNTHTAALRATAMHIDPEDVQAMMARMETLKRQHAEMAENVAAHSTANATLANEIKGYKDSADAQQAATDAKRNEIARLQAIRFKKVKDSYWNDTTNKLKETDPVLLQGILESIKRAEAEPFSVDNQAFMQSVICASIDIEQKETRQQQQKDQLQAADNQWQDYIKNMRMDANKVVLKAPIQSSQFAPQWRQPPAQVQQQQVQSMQVQQQQQQQQQQVQSMQVQQQQQQQQQQAQSMQVQQQQQQQQSSPPPFHLTNECLIGYAPDTVRVELFDTSVMHASIDADSAGGRDYGWKSERAKRLVQAAYQIDRSNRGGTFYGNLLAHSHTTWRQMHPPIC
jgi:hypothetical protein